MGLGIREVILVSLHDVKEKVLSYTFEPDGLSPSIKGWLPQKSVYFKVQHSFKKVKRRHSLFMDSYFKTNIELVLFCSFGFYQ